MPRGGQNKKPITLHMLEGTGRPSRLRRNGPRPQARTTQCPAWLEPAAKAEWRRVAAELRRLGVLTFLDRAVLAAYCQAYARWRQASEALLTEGLVVPGHRGVLRKHPLVSVAKQYLESVRAFAQELGLTPASRARLRVSPPPELDEMAKLVD